MKKLVVLGLSCGLILTACNGLSPKEEGEHNRTVNEGENNYLKVTQENENMSRRFLRDDTQVVFDGKSMQVKELERALQNKLELENAGLDFHLLIDAEEDNTE